MAASDKLVAVSDNSDFSSDCSISDDWQELTKSDYAKVIFSDLFYNAVSGNVECKFQITDNVHEDPSDFVGLYRIGYDDLSQCLVSKMLSQTKCEDDGKLQSCVFTSDELPHLDDGFYQFLYVTRDQEVCGASTPFQIGKPFPGKDTFSACSSFEKLDSGFLVIGKEKEKKVGEMNKQSKRSEPQEKTVQQNALSERKKEEIFSWICQHPNHCSLIEQITEDTFTIQALQESKDLAMKEVSQLWEDLKRQKDEVFLLKTMQKPIQNALEKKNEALNDLEKMVASYADKNKQNEDLLNEKEEQIKLLKKEFIKCYKQLRDSYASNNEYKTEVMELKKEITKMQEILEANERHQLKVAEEKEVNLEEALEKAKELQGIVFKVLANLDWKNEAEVKKGYELRMHLLNISSKMDRTTQAAKICKKDGLQKIIDERVEKDKENEGQTSDACSSDFKTEAPRAATQSTSINSSATKCDKENHTACESSGLKNEDLSTAIEPKSVNSSASKCDEKDQLSYDFNNFVKDTYSMVGCLSPGSRSSQSESGSSSGEESVVSEFITPDPLQLENIAHPIVELPRLEIILQENAQMLHMDSDDVNLINRLTEKILTRDPKLYADMEQADDSSSDTSSDSESCVSDCSDKDSIRAMRKYFLCVSRVMKNLYEEFPNDILLENFLVVKSEEDKSLLNRKEFGALLQKCALRYQTEILFDQVEKQKEGVKTVSANICDLFTKYMCIKDELNDSKSACEKLQTFCAEKDEEISRLKMELERRNATNVSSCSNADWKTRAKNAEKSVEEYRARLVEASIFYKEQYAERERLSKKVEKYKLLLNKTKPLEGESSRNSSIRCKRASANSLERLKKDKWQPVACSFRFDSGKKESTQNINDSDTGEHMFAKPSIEELKDTFKISVWNQIYDGVPGTKASPELVAMLEAMEKFAIPIEVKNGSGEQTAAAAATVEESIEPATVEGVEPASTSSYKKIQDSIKNLFAMHAANELGDLATCSTFCPFCDEWLPISSDLAPLINHLEHKHQINVCPVCGELFEAAVPNKYFSIHINHHFE